MDAYPLGRRAMCVHAYDAGIFLIDTGYQRPGFDAAYLIVEKDSAAFVDTGTAHSVPRLLAALDQAGVAREAVEYVCVTHVHLDHAGGAGALLRALPQARLVAHPRGAAHLVDPTRLIESATAVYGEERFRREYGRIDPVDATRVIEAVDGLRLALNGRELSFMDTPGHARHHYCVYDEASAGLFTGDTFGLAYPEFSSERGAFVFPTTTPMQFDPDAWWVSLSRLMALKPRHAYLTHFGRVDDLESRAQELARRIDDCVGIALRLADAPQRPVALEQELRAYLERELRHHGWSDDPRASLSRWDLDLELNAQGLDVWLTRRAK